MQFLSLGEKNVIDQLCFCSQSPSGFCLLVLFGWLVGFVFFCHTAISFNGNFLLSKHLTNPTDAENVIIWGEILATCVSICVKKGRDSRKIL